MKIKSNGRVSTTYSHALVSRVELEAALAMVDLASRKGGFSRFELETACLRVQKAVRALEGAVTEMEKEETK